MNNADLQESDIEVAAKVLTQQEPDPTRDDEQHHASRIAAQDYMESQAIHRCDYEGEYEYRIRHGGCDTIIQW